MPKKTRWAATGAAALLVVASLAFAQKQGILFPDWSKPTKGTYQAPAGKIGKKAAANAPWSTTTVDHVLNTPGLSDADKRAILGETAAKLLKIPS